MTAVKDVGSGIADELKRAREIRLLPEFPGRRRAVVGKELRATRGELGEQLAIAGDVAAACAVHDMPIRQPNRGSEQHRPRQRAEALPGGVQPGDAAGDARGQVSDKTLLSHVAGRIEIHVVRRRRRCGFAIIERQHFSRGAPVHDESAAPDVAGVGEHDFERERHGDRGVDRIAALFQNLHARLCRQRMSGDDHGVLRGRGPRAERPRRRNGARAANDNGVRGTSFGRGGFGRARNAGKRERRNQENGDLPHFLIWKLTRAAVNI